MAAAGLLGLQAIQGRVEVALGGFTGEPNSAWAGALMALVDVSFLGLAGFWMVKGSVARDEETGVGQILAATPIRRWEYTLGKAASHLLVLAAMSGVLVLSAVVLQLLGRSGERLDLVAIVMPIALIALPGFAVIAAFAVLFETLRFLARGFGSLAWLFFWSFLMVLAMEGPSLDLFGLATLRDALGARVLELDPTWSGEFRIGAGGLEDAATKRFRWEGLELTPHLVASRAGTLAVALGAIAMPLLAVALGVLSAGPRLFEGLYIALWYVGPFQRTPVVDFAGVTGADSARAVPFVFVAIGAALLVWALALELRRRSTGEARFV